MSGPMSGMSGLGACRAGMSGIMAHGVHERLYADRQGGNGAGELRHERHEQRCTARAACGCMRGRDAHRRHGMHGMSDMSGLACASGGMHQAAG